MTKREVIKLTIDGIQPPYVPWSFKFTKEPTQWLKEYYGADDLDVPLENHILNLGSDIGFFEDLGNDLFQDVFGVIWDRSIDKDIGIPFEPRLKNPNLAGYQFPDPTDLRLFIKVESEIKAKPSLFRVYQMGFSLFERAWTLRGMENLLMDFCQEPDFVHQLMNRITEYNLIQIRKALEFDIDAIYFGDDWGQQNGLIMGYNFWKKYIYPYLQKMYRYVRNAGKYEMIHSCGDVDELFPDLIRAGVNYFNPFQPEVMDTGFLINEYRGRLCFHGGLSIQRILPFGTPAEVEAETLRLIRTGDKGGLILSPSHSVESDTSLENVLAFIRIAHSQTGYRKLMRKPN